MKRPAAMPAAIAAAALLLLPGRPAAGAVEARRAAGPIAIDGDLRDPGWSGAARIEGFVETSPADNVPAPVSTDVLVAYDGEALYFGVTCADPDPAAIRAPFVARDAIAGSDDSVTILLDTRGDRRSAILLRVDPRGQQADGVFEEGTISEDLSPDFFFAAAAAIDTGGWRAEIRIPFSSLRYAGSAARNWGILVRRNYPRGFLHELASATIPRNANCIVCRSVPLEGIADLPEAGHLVLAPFATLSGKGEAEAPGRGLRNGPVRGNGGIDVKWTPSPGTAIDGTINPDFSQVESDVAQIGVNSRFALFFPEKRPFFLEGVDLLQTPIAAVSTRAITSPRWGARATGKTGAASYTLLVAEDRGGGSTILPGPEGSRTVLQPGSSIATIGRVRKDLGDSFAGFLVTDRENAGGTGGVTNRVFGPDFQWRLGAHAKLAGQVLFSRTRTPDRGDLAPEWDGRSFSSHALSLEASYNDPRWHLRALHDEAGDGFRADLGFVPQVGYRHEKVVAARDAYASGPISRVRSGFYCDYFARPDGALLQRNCGLFVSPSGIANLGGEIDLTIGEKDRVGNRVVDSPLVLTVWGLSIDPGRVVSSLSLSGFLGDSPDFVNARPGRGGDAALTATLHPTRHLQLDVIAERQWLDVPAEGSRRRLFTSHLGRLKATYNFTASAFARLIGQYERTARDPALYSSVVARRDAAFEGSVLVGYRLDWQTVAFLGYGDEREADDAGRFRPKRRSLFLKVSYAFQR